MQENKLHNIFKNIPTDLNNEIFEVILQNDIIKLERIISEGHITPKGQWYEQDFDEWVLLLSGKAILSFEDQAKSYTLLPGDYIMIKAYARHRVEYTDTDNKTIWLALHIKNKK